jgi:hypothetical protein
MERKAASPGSKAQVYGKNVRNAAWFDPAEGELIYQSGRLVA